MIVLASNYVGYRVVDYLSSIAEPIDYLILDTADRGGYNNKITSIFNEHYQNSIIATQEDLAKDSFIKKLVGNGSHLGISAWWPYILRGQLLSVPERGWLNFHPSLLPYNRGKHPNFWCLVDETPCGVSLHFIDEGIDTGDIVAARSIDVGWEDTGKTIYEESLETIVDLFIDSFKDIKQGSVRLIKQQQDEGTFHHSSEIDIASQIDLDKQYTARKLFNIIRGRMFSPYPTAFFYDGEKKYSVEILIKEVKDSD